jgi:F-type H+-transporting ATPase subunit b
MSLLSAAIGLAMENTPHHDDQGITTSSPIWPEHYEIVFGTFASVVVGVLLYKLAWPAAVKAMKARTAKVQAALDSAEADKMSAEAEAANIRQAKGDIAAERERLLSDADAQAEALLNQGRARLEAEIAEMKTTALSDIQSAYARKSDELRAEIARLSSAAVDHVVTGTLDEATQQRLIEDFITRVGASTAAAAGAGS